MIIFIPACSKTEENSWAAESCSLALLLCAEASFAQVATTSSTSTSTIDTSLPVAYVYVSSSHYIHAYKAWARWHVHQHHRIAVPASPAFAKMSVTKSFLFGTDAGHKYFHLFHPLQRIDQQMSSDQTGDLPISGVRSRSRIRHPGRLQPGDRYITVRVRSDSTPNQYLSFHIQSDGSLQFLGGSGGAYQRRNTGYPG